MRQKFTRGEIRMMESLIQGNVYKQVAFDLNSTPDTIRVAMRRLREKHECGFSNEQLVVVYVEWKHEQSMRLAETITRDLEQKQRSVTRLQAALASLLI